MKDIILELYQEVFSAEGAVKNCGKDKCIELMLALRKLFPLEDFGDASSGMMNMDKVKTAIRSLQIN